VFLVCVDQIGIDSLCKIRVCDIFVASSLFIMFCPISVSFDPLMVLFVSICIRLHFTNSFDVCFVEFGQSDWS
jgi:hypothetical protein